jgi:hypothetical protein
MQSANSVWQNLRSKTLVPGGAEVLQDFLCQPYLAVGPGRLLVDPFRNLDCRRQIARQHRFFEPGLEFLLVDAVPFDPGRQVLLRRQVVRLRVVAPTVIPGL